MHKNVVPISLKISRLIAVCLLLLAFIDHCTAQRVRRRHPHYPKFEIIWPLHWVSAVYVWGFLKLGAIFAGLMLLFAFRQLSGWNSGPTYISHDAPVYHFRGFGTELQHETDSKYSNDEVLYWTDMIKHAFKQFGKTQ